MKILILGAKGNLGTQLTGVFSPDHETIAWDRDDIDALDFPLLEEKLRALKPDLIINTVAFNAVDSCEEAEGFELAMRLNRDLPAVLARIAREMAAVLIHYSTDYVFCGHEGKITFSETDVPNPGNKYGESKFAGELEVIKEGEAGLDYYLIRTSKLFGPRGSSPDAKASFFDIMLELAQTKDELQVVKEELSCFTYTRDLALATKRLWDLEAPFGVYHLVNEGPCTWYEAADMLFSERHQAVKLRPIRSEDLRRAARRPKYSVLMNTKSKKLRPFAEALNDYINS